MKTFTTLVQMENFIQSACEKAIENVAKRATEELESYIQEDFYRQYSPRYYDRTYQLLKSPKFNLLGKNTAKVFIDTDAMHYLAGEDGFTGEDSAYYASLGWHGSPNIVRDGRYWEDFIEWANKNIPVLMKQELKKQGLNVV